MIKMIRLQTPDGVREYAAFESDAEYRDAFLGGEIHVGDDVIYKNYLVWVLEDGYMLVLDQIQSAPQFVPNMGGMPDMGGNWSFTINGQPVDPAQMEQFMRGGQVGK